MPQILVAPYPSAEEVLNIARAAMADAGIDPNTGNIVGDAFTDARPSTWILLQSAYKETQDELANSGSDAFAETAIILNIPPVATQDQGSEVFIDYTGYSDGVNALNPAIFLPPDLRIPLWMQQRQAGTQLRFLPDPPIGPCNDGLPSRSKTIYSFEWEWRRNRIYMVGALQSLDIRLRYIPFLPKIVFTGNSQVDGAQQLSIPGCENAVGYLTAAKFVASVGSTVENQISKLENKGKEYIAQLITQTMRGGQRTNHRRQPYSLSRRGGANIIRYR